MHVNIAERYRFPLYANAADYLAKTGRIAPWDPAQPERHWEALKETGPFDMVPSQPGAAAPGVFTGDASFVNIPHSPVVVEWNPPKVSVVHGGQEVSGVGFMTMAEALGLIIEINKTADGTKSPKINENSLREFPGFLFPYVYGPGESRRPWLAWDANGVKYELWTLLATRNQFGSGIVSAGFGSDGSPTNIQHPPGYWTYQPITGWLFSHDEATNRVGAAPAPAQAGSVGPAILLKPGESLVWESSLVGQTVAVDTGEVDDSALGPLSPLQAELLRIARDTNRRTRNIEVMLAAATGGAPPR